jgi:predicted  nucleic acid-binding Zn-ribbon protein
MSDAIEKLRELFNPPKFDDLTKEVHKLLDQIEAELSEARQEIARLKEWNAFFEDLIMKGEKELRAMREGK